MRSFLIAASTVTLAAAMPALATNPPLPPNDDQGQGLGVATMSTGEHLTGMVKRIYPVYDGNVYFRLAGTCKTATYFYFSTTAEGGRSWYAMLLSAAASARPVRISLPQACNDAQNQAVQYVFQDF